MSSKLFSIDITAWSSSCLEKFALNLFLKSLPQISSYRTGSHDDFMTSRPAGQEGHCFLIVDLHPGHVKSLTGIGDVATRVDMRIPQKFNSLSNIYPKG